MGVGGQSQAPAILPTDKRPGTHCIGGWMRPRVYAEGAENLVLTGFRSPDRQARSESLYRLRNPGPLYYYYYYIY